MCGLPSAIKAASEILGFEVVGKSWDAPRERLRYLEGGKLVYFRSLYETSMGAISKVVSTTLHQLAGIGDVYVIELAYSGREAVGDIIFMMPKNKEILNREAIEIYAGQFGSLLNRLRIEKELARANDNMTNVLKSTLFGVVIIDKNRFIRWANPVTCQMLGLENLEDLIGKSCGKYFCPEDQQECPIMDKGELVDNSERILRRSDGQITPIIKTVSQIEVEGENVFLETFVDNRERKKAEEALAERLELEKVISKISSYFVNELNRLDKSREHPIAVISADMDGLKLINDTVGHAEGDRYLKAGAELLQGSLRSSDILARVGGDEFALLLPGADKTSSEMLVSRIRHQVENYNQSQEGLPLSISIGLAISDSHQYPLKETYRLADSNMYSDKLQQSKNARADIVSSLLSSLFNYSNLAEGNREEVQVLAVRLGQSLDLDEKRIADLELLAQVYDLGKICLPDNTLHESMLKKAEELSEADREAIRRHPEAVYRIANASPELAGIADLILRHHENYDGSGYPLGLKGEEIPLECRILSIAIALSAMINPRPYAETLTNAEALAELKRCSGKQFDPKLVEQFENRSEGRFS